MFINGDDSVAISNFLQCGAEFFSNPRCRSKVLSKAGLDSNPKPRILASPYVLHGFSVEINLH